MEDNDLDARFGKFEGSDFGKIPEVKTRCWYGQLTTGCGQAIDIKKKLNPGEKAGSCVES